VKKRQNLTRICPDQAAEKGYLFIMWKKKEKERGHKESMDRYAKKIRFLAFRKPAAKNEQENTMKKDTASGRVL